MIADFKFWVGTLLEYVKLIMGRCVLQNDWRSRGEEKTKDTRIRSKR